MLKLLMVFVFLLSSPAWAVDFTVDDAYKTIPHSRTQFDQSRAKMSAEEAKYLDNFFFVSDLAMRERVLMLKYFDSDKQASYIVSYNKQINEILASFRLIQAPTNQLKNVEKLLITAIREQQAFFNEQMSKNATLTSSSIYTSYRNHKMVNGSHKKLIQAYNMLRGSYEKEGDHNMKAFFDHLCALDFI